MDRNWIKVNNSIIDATTNELICIMPNTVDPVRDKILECAPGLFAAAIKFVAGIEDGSNPTRSIYKEMSEILSKVPKDIIYDERMQIQ